MYHTEILVGITLLSAIFVLLIKRLKARKKALTPGNHEDAATKEGSSDIFSDEEGWGLDELEFGLDETGWGIEELEFDTADIGTDDTWPLEELEFGTADIGTDDAWPSEELEFDTADIGMDEE